ncbi:hypothetical protein LshimejAT787_1201120 [Lyophyllum shimeji]|uniref:F-box domain-containing protein n=1 Tax=Lyophyllum shimeji TaxID=47721 RepID=A0A9P3PW38_LYOSH|nr:hypothetical protein LshimejAT787_1201120 [Lyophyllum shimeji]
MSASLLTTEVLSEIFLFIQASPHDVGGLPRHVILSHVTGQWRSLALDMPILWTDIQLTSHSNLDAQRESILRSRDCELDISITLILSSSERRRRVLRLRYSTNITHRLSLITPIASRWRKLSVSGDNATMADIIPLLVPLRFPRLQRLELVNASKRHVPHFGPFHFDPAIFSTLLLHGVTIHTSERTHLGGLEGLDIRQISTCMIDQGSLDSLSDTNTPAHPPTMLHLTRLCIILASPAFPLHPSFDPASLVDLKLGGFHGSSRASIPALIVLFNAVSGPNLQRLELDAVVGFAWSAFVQSLHAAALPKYPGLTTLTLRSLELRDMDADFAAAFPAITRLVLGAVDPGPLHALRRNNRSVWPRLELVVSIDPTGNSN